MPRPTIAIDIDDVLAVSASRFLEYSNQQWHTSLVLDDYTEHLGKLWGVDRDECMRRLAQYIADDNFAHLEVAAGAQLALRQLKGSYRLVVLTSRFQSLADQTQAWLDQHFMGVFDDVHFSNIWDGSHHADVAHKLTKADRCLEIGADYLIDDQPHHCTGAAEVGVQAILFGIATPQQNNELLGGTIVS